MPSLQRSRVPFDLSLRRTGALLRPAGVLVILAAAALLMLTGAGPARAAKPVAHGKVTGAITGAPKGTTLKGTRVVLVRFKLDAQGQPKGEAVGSQKADAQGHYTFDNVPIEARTVFQIGATVDGRMVGSQPFTFPAGQHQIVLNLPFPHLTSDSSALRIDEGVIAVEPHRGEVFVTEVLHLMNAGPDVIEGVKQPLEVDLPKDAKDLEVLSEIEPKNGHERLGSELLFYGNFDPGRTTVAYRYRLPVWLGTLTLHKRYPHKVGTLSVLAPHGSLQMESASFTPQDEQKIANTNYDAWSATDISADQPVTIRLSGVPVDQQVYLVPTVGFAVVMLGVLVWFVRRRLREAERSA